MEACGFRDNYEAIREQDAVVVGVSPDSTQSHRRFKAANALPFPLVADPDRTVIKLYDVHRRGFGLPLTKRVTYLIDKTGVIRDVFHHELAIGRHKDTVLEALESINAGSQGSLN